MVSDYIHKQENRAKAAFKGYNVSLLLECRSKHSAPAHRNCSENDD